MGFSRFGFIGRENWQHSNGIFFFDHNGKSLDIGDNEATPSNSIISLAKLLQDHTEAQQHKEASQLLSFGSANI